MLWDTYIRMETGYTRLFDEYVAAAGGMASQEVYGQIAELFSGYESNFTSEEEKLDPRFYIYTARLSGLMMSSKFMSDMRSVPMIEMLADLSFRARDPWRFEMFEQYTEGIGYELLPGFDPKNLPVFRALANSETLWNGTNNEVKRVFMTNVARVLRELGLKYPSVFVDVVQPRVAIIERNKALRHPYHGPECKADFRPKELETLNTIIRNLQDTGATSETLDVLEKAFTYAHEAHEC